MYTQQQKVKELEEKLLKMRTELRREGVVLALHKEYQALCNEVRQERKKLGNMMAEQLIDISDEPVLLEYAKSLWGERYLRGDEKFYIDKNMQDYYIYAERWWKPLLIGSDEY